MPGRCPENSTDFQSKVRLYPMTSTAAVRRAPHVLAAVDVAFIDGAHDFHSVIFDLRTWWPRIRVGGYLVGHDFTMSEPGTMKAVWWFFSRILHEAPMEVFLDTDCTWWVQKGVAGSEG